MSRLEGKDLRISLFVENSTLISVRNTYFHFLVPLSTVMERVNQKRVLIGVLSDLGPGDLSPVILGPGEFGSGLSN